MFQNDLRSFNSYDEFYKNIVWILNLLTKVEVTKAAIIFSDVKCVRRDLNLNG